APRQFAGAAAAARATISWSSTDPTETPTAPNTALSASSRTRGSCDTRVDGVSDTKGPLRFTHGRRGDRVNMSPVRYRHPRTSIAGNQWLLPCLLEIAPIPLSFRSPEARFGARANAKRSQQRNGSEVPANKVARAQFPAKH